MGRHPKGQQEQNGPFMFKNIHVLQQSALAIIAGMTMGREKANQELQRKKEE